MPDIQLIFLDIDGTLIGQSGKTHPVAQRAMEELKERGYRLALCTGRPAGGVAGALSLELGEAHGPHIFLGGALTLDAKDHVVHQEVVPASALRPLVEHARRGNLTLELYTKDTIFVDQHTSNALRHSALLELPKQTEQDLLEVLEHQTILKAQWIVSHDQAKVLMENTPKGCFQAIGMSDGMPDVTFITVTSANVDKGSAVTRVMKSLNITSDQACAVGDSTGDLPMLHAVGRPFAMANGHQELLEQFPVLGDVEEDGIGKLAALLAK